MAARHGTISPTLRAGVPFVWGAEGGGGWRLLCAPTHARGGLPVGALSGLADKTWWRPLGSWARSRKNLGFTKGDSAWQRGWVWRGGVGFHGGGCGGGGGGVSQCGASFRGPAAGQGGGGRAFVVRRVPCRSPIAPGGWGGPRGPSRRPSSLPPVWWLQAWGKVWEVGGLRVRGGPFPCQGAQAAAVHHRPRRTSPARRPGPGARAEGGNSPQVLRCASGRGRYVPWLRRLWLAGGGVRPASLAGTAWRQGVCVAGRLGVPCAVMYPTHPLPLGQGPAGSSAWGGLVTVCAGGARAAPFWGRQFRAGCARVGVPGVWRVSGSQVRGLRCRAPLCVSCRWRVPRPPRGTLPCVLGRCGPLLRGPRIVGAPARVRGHVPVGVPSAACPVAWTAWGEVCSSSGGHGLRGGAPRVIGWCPLSRWRGPPPPFCVHHQGSGVGSTRRWAVAASRLPAIAKPRGPWLLSLVGPAITCASAFVVPGAAVAAGSSGGSASG